MARRAICQYFGIIYGPTQESGLSASTRYRGWKSIILLRNVLFLVNDPLRPLIEVIFLICRDKISWTCFLLTKVKRGCRLAKTLLMRQPRCTWSMKWVASFARNMPCTKCPLRYPSQAAPSNCATRQAVCPSAEGLWPSDYIEIRKEISWKEDLAMNIEEVIALLSLSSHALDSARRLSR